MQKPSFEVALITLYLSLSCCSSPTSFEVTKVDYHNNALQRIFVVIDPDSVYKRAYIQKTICALTEEYPFTEHSNISFFADKRYANYKTELFVNEVNQEITYGEWADSQWLGEFEFTTGLYLTYPASNLPDKQRTFRMQPCTP